MHDVDSSCLLLSFMPSYPLPGMLVHGQAFAVDPKQCSARMSLLSPGKLKIHCKRVLTILKGKRTGITSEEITASAVNIYSCGNLDNLVIVKDLGSFCMEECHACHVSWTLLCENKGSENIWWGGHFSILFFRPLNPRLRTSIEMTSRFSGWPTLFIFGIYDLISLLHFSHSPVS